MQLLLGLFFFSILVTTGTSLKCVYCLAINGYCSDVKEDCPSENYVCMSLKLKSKDNKIHAVVQTCILKDECQKFENRTATVPSIPGISFENVITEATCNKAPPSFASFFPAFLGLLLMKLLL